jgi:hypothetical protein
MIKNVVIIDIWYFTSQQQQQQQWINLINTDCDDDRYQWETNSFHYYKLL